MRTLNKILIRAVVGASMLALTSCECLHKEYVIGPRIDSDGTKWGLVDKTKYYNGSADLRNSSWYNFRSQWK
jgi:hypothetical protein